MKSEFSLVVRAGLCSVVLAFSLGSLGADCGGTGDDVTDAGTAGAGGSGTAGAGGSGTAGDGGAAGQSVGGSGGSGGASGDACTDCVQSKCAAEIAACNQSCQQLVVCASNCADNACVEGCKATYPNDVAAAQAFVDCGMTQCSTECNAGTGGTAGGSSVGNCAAAIKGCWLHPNTAIKYYFDGVSQVNNIFWTPESGDTPYWGNYTCNDSVVSMSWSDGSSKTGQLSNGKIVINGYDHTFYGPSCP